MTNITWLSAEAKKSLTQDLLYILCYADPKLLPSSSAKKVKTTDGNDGKSKNLAHTFIYTCILHNTLNTYVSHGSGDIIT